MEGLEMKSGFWLDRPVLVTGATGLLGSCLTRRLLDGGAEVVAFVRDWVPQSEFVRSGVINWARVVRGDIRNGAEVERALAEYEIDTVFHLAAQTIVSIANRNPISTFETNVQGTVNVLEACRSVRTVRQVIAASSDKAYGDHELLPYREDAPLQGRHPYDVSKSCSDLICGAYAKTYDLPVCVTRCGNFYGAGDLNWNRIVPGTIRSVMRGERPVIRSDGTFIRDYFYIEDGAAAYMTLAEKLAADRALSGEAFNFSNELQITVLDLVKKILFLMKSDLTPDVRNEVSNEIRHQYLSAEKARKVLGWKPLYTLDEGLAHTIKWYTEFLGDAGK
jgi:CDP-glucose 4,6-dehydratase